jgi:hypothetical protein
MGAVARGLRPLPRAPRPHRDLGREAGHRKNRAVQHLETLGFKADGVISHDHFLKAVRDEFRRRRFDEVILAMNPKSTRTVARWIHSTSATFDWRTSGRFCTPTSGEAVTGSTLCTTSRCGCCGRTLFDDRRLPVVLHFDLCRRTRG